MANTCEPGLQISNVTSAMDALNLAQIVNCTGSGLFEVYWRGRIELEATISISNGTNLTISGSSGAVIDGSNQVQLFAASSSTLYLADLVLENGNARSGGALESSSSNVTVANCTFQGNYATVNGGALHVDNDTNLVLEGTNNFSGNVAENQGGAIRAGSSSVNINGTANFQGNVATSGGAVAVSDVSFLHLAGDSLFQNNTAWKNGGALYGYSSIMNTSSDGESYFVENTAGTEFGGGLYWASDDGTDSIELTMPFSFESNSAPTGGAMYATDVYLLVEGACFRSNKASKNGGGLVTHVVGLRSEDALIDNCEFDSNTAEVNGGAAVISAGFVTIQDSNFSQNRAGETREFETALCI